MNILVLTEIIPGPIVSKKKRMNDVLVTTAERHEATCKDVQYTFVMVVPYSNFLLAYLSPLWREYKQFIDLEKYSFRDRVVEIVAVPSYRKSLFLKSLLNSIGYLINKRKLKRLIKENNIDVVHAHNVNVDAGIAYRISKDFNIPYVVTTRNIGKINLSKTVEKYISGAKALISLGFRDKQVSDKFNTPSYLIAHGIDNSFILKNRSYQIRTGPIKIVTVSRLLQWKNIDKVFLALEKIEGDFVYDIYGDGPAGENLKNLLLSSPIRSKVTFKGHVPYERVPDILVDYDLFVLPSYNEIFGRVYIEAMACGLPVIGAKNCGIAGYITEGVHGYTINHRDVSELANAIQMFVSDRSLAEVLGKNGKVLSNAFSWEKIINNLDEVYRTSVKTL